MVLAHVVKYFYVSPRPFITLLDARVIFENGSGLDSFPSGHATFLRRSPPQYFFTTEDWEHSISSARF